MSQNSLVESITQAVLSFVNAKNWSRSKQIVETQQDLLLTDDADALFADLLAQYADDAQATRTLSGQRALLERCRTEGIDAAFADKIRPATPDIPPELMAQLMSIESEEQLTELLMAHPELLPVLAAMQQASPQATSDTPQALADKLLAFIRADSWAERKAYLEAHPGLLTDEALGVLTLLISQAQQQSDEEVYQTLIQHRDLLERSRSEGIDAAFADLMTASPPSEATNALLLNALMQCNSPDAVFELATEHPELLSDEVDALLQQAIANAQAQGTGEGEAYAQHVAARLNTLRQLRQMMDEAGVSAEEAAQTVLTEQQRPPQQVIDATLAFVNPGSWDEKKRIVEQERELLLADVALQVFADLLSQYKEDANVTRTLIQYRDLLQRCRAEGIDAAFADLVSRPSGDGASMDEGLQQALALLQEMMQWDDQVAFVEQNFAHFTPHGKSRTPQFSTLVGYPCNGGRLCFKLG